MLLAKLTILKQHTQRTEYLGGNNQRKVLKKEMGSYFYTKW